MDTTNLLAKIKSDDVLQTMLVTGASKTQSDLHKSLCDVVSNDIREELDKKKKKKVLDVRRNLTEAQIQVLGDLYPERKIITSSSERGTHSMAAAMRKIETDYVLSMFPKNSLIYDIGGNWATHAKRGDEKRVHCCCPILEYRDAQRRMNRLLNYKKFVDDSENLSVEVARRARMIDDDNDKIEQNLKAGKLTPCDLNGRWFCLNKFEDCIFDSSTLDVKPKSLVCAMAIHSIYDIDVHDLASALRKKGVKRMIGTFLFSVDMLLGKKEGKLPTVNGFYQIVGDKVRYGFYDDPNCGYEHNLRSLKKYLTKTFIKTPDGGVFYLELTDLRGDVMYFTLTDATEARYAKVLNDESFKYLPVDSLNKVVFPLFDLDTYTKELVFHEAILPKDFVHRAIEYVSRCKDNQLTADLIVGYLSSTNNAVVIGGSARKVEEKVDPQLLPMIATTLQIYVEMQRAKQKDILKKLRMRTDVPDFKILLEYSIHKVFGAAGVYKKTLAVFASWLSFAYGQNVINIIDMPMYVEIRDRIRLWSSNVSCDDDFSLNFYDLDRKVQLHEEYDRERRMISDKVVKDKLWKSLYPNEDNSSESLNDTVTEVTEFSSEFKSDNIESLCKTTAVKSSKAVSAVFLNEWCESPDMFFTSRNQKKERKFYGMIKHAFNVCLECIVPEYEFEGLDVIYDNNANLQIDCDECEDVASGYDGSQTSNLSITSLEDLNGREALEIVAEDLLVSSCEIIDSTMVEKSFIQDPVTASPTSLKAISCIEDYVEDEKCTVDFPNNNTDNYLVSSDGSVCTEVTVEKPSISDPVDIAITYVETKVDLESVKDDESTVDFLDDLCSDDEIFDENDQIQKQKTSRVAFNDNRVCYSKLPVPPEFSNVNDHYTNAKIEYLWYLECKIVCDKSTMTDIIKDYVHGMYHNDRCDLPKGAFFLIPDKSGLMRWFPQRPEKIGHAYGVRFDPDSWLNTAHLTELRWSRDGDKFLSDKPVFASAERGCFLVCDLTYLMNEKIILQNLKKTMSANSEKRRIKPPCVKLVDGVPGCGKSTDILRNANLSKHYVLTMGREAADDLRNRFKSEKKATVEQLHCVRTVDSYLMGHDKKSRRSVLHFDEALMAHAGMVYFCAEMLSARKIICQGDSQQIPFVNRVEMIDLRWKDLEITEVEKKRDTYRCPIDVAAYLTCKGYYGNDIVRTHNDVLRSMKVKGPKNGFTSIYSLDKLKNCQYLTFTQSEKEDVKKFLGAGNWSVNTVHESQGKTYDHVVLVRLKPTENAIYPGGRISKPYVTVAVTRHRRSLVYYTAAQDALCNDIEMMLNVQENKLMKHLVVESVQ